MITLFSNLLSKYQEKYQFSPEPIIGLLLLKSNDNMYRLLALKKYQSICGTNRIVSDKWTQALYMKVSINEYIKTGDQIPVDKWESRKPNCHHKSYRRISDLSDFNIDNLTRNDIGEGHSGVWLMPARSC